MTAGRVCARGFDVRVGSQILTYLPGDRVPDEVAALVENPAIWTPRGQKVEDYIEPPAEGEIEEEEFLEEEHDYLESMTVSQLRGFAHENNIPLHDATKKADIIDAIRDATIDG